MLTITLENVQAEHTRLGHLIELLKTPTTKVIVLPETSIELQPGEHYAGMVLDANGLSHHLILLPGEAEDVKWADAVAAAKAMGGELPTRQEQALLYANLKAEFQAAWYWSCEEHNDSSCAWYQTFYDGIQGYSHKSYAGRARAVRRFTA